VPGLTLATLAAAACRVTRRPSRIVRNVAHGTVLDAFRAEAERLSERVAGEDQAAGFANASPCPPWTVGELLCHVRIAVGRAPAALAGPEPSDGPVVPAAGYYRPGERFSAATNAERIAVARRAAAALGSPAAIAADFGQAWREAWTLAGAAPAGRLVRTRHGDRMLLTEFLRTRVLELAVHGLDIAAGLGREPWLTVAAARVVEDLVLPGAAVGPLLGESGWDHATLVAKATGRIPVTAADSSLLDRHGARRLALS
jgi:uncharacterized protein (TIGR03083 family)